MLSQHFLFFFSMLGAFNGLGLAIFLWLKAKGNLTQRWLALLIFVISLRTGKSVAFYFWPEIPTIVLQLGLTACLLIGPCLFFLVRTHQRGELQRADRWHIAAILIVTVIMNLIFPYSDHRNFWLWLVEISWIAYIVWASLDLFGFSFRPLPHLLQPRARLLQTSSGQFLLGIWIGVGLIWLAYFTSGYTSYILGALTFTLVLAASVLVYWRVQAGKTPIAPYEDRRIPAVEAAALLQALSELMARERLHLDPGLTLPRLARRLGQPQARLSQLLNDNNQTTFKQYITHLRVEEAKSWLRLVPEKSLESVAEAAGFQSMSTFFNTFKKLEGITPAAFRARSAS
jgi:AraC-like DNA-binding protein